MTSASAGHPLAHLMSVWKPSAREPVHHRLVALLAAIDSADLCRDDTLGQRNQRLLRLHRVLVGRPLEARITCAQCGVDSEFTVPTDGILAASPPSPEARVRIRACGRSLAFRLPRMSDIETASRASGVGGVRRAVLEMCRVSGDVGLITDAVAERLGGKFEARDGAASIIVNMYCSGCHAAIAGSIDVATFVARDLDRLIDSLYSDIHEIASAYGWDESTILALPSERRRGYVSMITSRRQSRTGMAWGAA